MAFRIHELTAHEFRQNPCIEIFPAADDIVLQLRIHHGFGDFGKLLVDVQLHAQASYHNLVS